MNLISRAVAQEGATTSGEMGTLCCVPLTEKYVVIMLPTNNQQQTLSQVEGQADKGMDRIVDGMWILSGLNGAL